MTTTFTPTSLYEVGSGGDRVYIPGITFELEQHNSVLDAVQYGIYQRHQKVGTWCYTGSTGVIEMSFIQEFPVREWFTESNASFITEIIRNVSQ